MRKPDFPESVKIGYRRFKIVELPKEEADRTGEFGRLSPTEGAIHVQVDGVSLQEQCNTLLHEIVHAAWIECGFRGASDANLASEEAVATGITNVITVVMQSNPQVRDWLVWAWSQEF